MTAWQVDRVDFESSEPTCFIFGDDEDAIVEYVPRRQDDPAPWEWTVNVPRPGDAFGRAESEAAAKIAAEVRMGCRCLPCLATAGRAHYCAGGAPVRGRRDACAECAS